jgi:hypothetical protein
MSAPPIFIVGCPRSGTTLLAALFDRHSQVAVPPESHFFSHFRATLSRAEKNLETDAIAQAFVSAKYTRDLGLDARSLATRVGSESVSLPQFFDAAMQEFAAARGKTVWAEKTPEHLFFVKDLLNWYPQARIVCIVRDGRDATMSMDAIPWTMTSSRGHAAIWRESAQYSRRWSREYRDSFHTLRFEDLLADPRGVLTETMNHAGLEFEARQLEAAPATNVVPAWEVSVKQNVALELDASRAYAWKKTASPNQLRIMTSMMKAELRACGYPDTEIGPSVGWPVAACDSVLNRAYRLLYSHRLANARLLVRRLLGGLAHASPHATREAPLRRAADSEQGR